MKEKDKDSKKRKKTSKQQSNRAALAATTGDTFRPRNALKGALSEI